MYTKVKRALLIGIGLVAVTLFISVSTASAVTQNCFTDVNTSHWFHDFVCWMYDNGLSVGYPDGTFRPLNNITRAESAVLAQRGYELAEANDDDTLAGLSCTTDQIAMWNGSAWVCAADGAGADGVPAGAVMSFNLAACPVGWSEATAAQGRAMVGKPAGGTLAGTVGGGLSDLEDRTHTHDVDPPNTSTTFTTTHTHSVNPLNTLSTSDVHNHTWAFFSNTERWYSYNAAGSSFVMVDHDDGMGAEGVGYYPVAEDSIAATTRSYYTANDNHNHYVDISAFTSSPGSGHSHSVDIPNTSSTTASTSDAMPYIQYLMCQKD